MSAAQRQRQMRAGAERLPRGPWTDDELAVAQQLNRRIDRGPDRILVARILGLLDDEDPAE